MTDLDDTETIDPHESTISPDDPRLKLSRPKSRVLKKGLVMAVSVVVIGLIMLAVSIALLPQPGNKEAREEEIEASTIQRQVYLPDSIRNAPDNGDPVPIPVTVKAPEAAPELKALKTGGLAPPSGQSYVSPVVNEREKAVTSGLFFDGAGGGVEPVAQRYLDPLAQGLGGVVPAAASMPPGSPDKFSQQNMQDQKNKFLGSGSRKHDNTVSAQLVESSSPFEVKAGSIIPITLITGINSDLPGDIIGQVRENVYDTVTGNLLLIPQGTRVLATYDSMVAYAQNRVLVCWNRLIRPDGSSLSFDCAPGVDLAGYAGFKDRVNNHYIRLVGGVLISSVLAATATISAGSDIGIDQLSFQKIFAANTGQNLNNVGQQITEKNLNVQPTVTVRPGFNVNLLVNKDMIIPPYTG